MDFQGNGDGGSAEGEAEGDGEEEEEEDGGGEVDEESLMWDAQVSVWFLCNGRRVLEFEWVGARVFRPSHIKGLTWRISLSESP